MSILIKGMEMPTNCNTCELAALVDISDGLAYGCKALKEMISNDRERLPNCPLVPVPPHGRLIDADALIDYCKHFAEVFKGSSLPTDKARRDELLGVIGEIVNAPTIIPAEEGET